MTLIPPPGPPPGPPPPVAPSPSRAASPPGASSAGAAAARQAANQQSMQYQAAMAVGTWSGLGGQDVGDTRSVGSGLDVTYQGTTQRSDGTQAAQFQAQQHGGPPGQGLQANQATPDGSPAGLQSSLDAAYNSLRQNYGTADEAGLGEAIAQVGANARQAYGVRADDADIQARLQHNLTDLGRAEGANDADGYQKAAQRVWSDVDRLGNNRSPAGSGGK